MLIAVTVEQAGAILRAMGQVVTAGNRQPLTDAGRRSIQATARHLFRLADAPDADALSPITPPDLGSVLSEPPSRTMAARFLAVTALVDGTLDAGKVALALDYAAALGSQEDYLRQLEAAISGRLSWALADMTRQNIKSLWDQPWRDENDVMALILPYQEGRADPALAARHEALGRLPEGSFGRAYWGIYKANGYAFPGDPRGVNAAFARPHDSTHVLSGYDTSPQGEILVSTFTAGMHPKLPMEGHILPVIFSWHLGIEINKFAGSARGAMDPEKFWVAWARGSDTRVDLFEPDWDFWAVAEEPVASLRQRYCVPPLDPRHAAAVR
ncbi:MAG: hypothetical protein EPO61_04870 [Nitrospirae bacterium]|nr:MAG: hypothetical protein EPO61_04870 [Nitrospirota bacterium]